MKKVDNYLKDKGLNVNFYMNRVISQPTGDYIDNIHKNWVKDYKKLEVHHGWVQWLYPNKYSSKYNNKAEPLKDEEIEEFLSNKEIG
jgi:hypothetical protein